MSALSSFLTGFTGYARKNPWKVALVATSVVAYFTAINRSAIKRLYLNFTKNMSFPELMSVILKHESHGYADHNFYVGNNLRSYVKGLFGTPYPGLGKDLTDLSISEILKLQAADKFSPYGKLWAVGRYQVIPPTMKEVYEKSGLKPADKFTPENQDKIGMYLLTKKRPYLGRYLLKKVPDNDQNLKLAALDVAMEWSSVGVPYPVNGVQTNQSYYSKHGEKASTSTEDVQAALKKTRGS